MNLETTPENEFTPVSLTITFTKEDELRAFVTLFKALDSDDGCRVIQRQGYRPVDGTNAIVKKIFLKSNQLASRFFKLF